MVARARADCAGGLADLVAAIEHLLGAIWRRSLVMTLGCPAGRPRLLAVAGSRWPAWVRSRVSWASII